MKEMLQGIILLSFIYNRQRVMLVVNLELAFCRETSTKIKWSLANDKIHCWVLVTI